LQRVCEDLTATAFAASLNEVPPCPRPLAEVKAEISNQLKELAASMQKFNIQQDTNAAQFSPTVDALGQLAPRLANTVKLLASTHPTPALQVVSTFSPLYASFSLPSLTFFYLGLHLASSRSD
jgi:hypothetical protein